MLNKWKRVLTLCLAVLLVVSLTACGETGGQNATTAPTSAVGDGTTYTVTLDPNGGVFADGTTEAITVTVNGGTVVDFQSNMPTYEGNTLYGWYMPDGMPWPGAKKVDRDLTLTAKWSVTQEVEVYKLTLVSGGETITMEYDNGVYQFTKVSMIYGGYAQRSGKYTIREEDLLAAMQADDGTVGRVLYVAESNYIDATGKLYAEFYNDGEFELFYDYTNDGKRTKYSMETGFWTYEGYTAPVAPVELPEDTNGVHSHENWDTSLLPVEDDPGEATEPTEPVEVVFETIPGATILSVDALESETMKLHFCENGVMTIFMTTYEMDIDKGYTWSYSEEDGLIINYKGGEENLAVDNGDGTYNLSDGYGNAYTIVLADLQAVLPAPTTVYTASASNSETMFLFFNDNHSVEVKYDLTSYGMAGQYSTVASGQWHYDAEAGLEVAIAGGMITMTDDGAGNLTLEYGGNTYVIVIADLSAAIGG